MVRELIHHSADINKHTEDEWSPLRVARCNNYRLVVKELLKCSKINTEQSHISGCTAFYKACKKGDLKKVRDMMNHSVDINQSNENGFSALQVACDNNHIEVVNELLKYDGIDIEHTDNSGCTAFYMACQEGNVEIVEELIRHSVNVNASDGNGLSPLQAACNNNNRDVVKQLLKCDNIDVEHSDNVGRTAFYLPCHEDNVDIVMDMIKHSVDVNKSNDNGFSPLQTASYNNYIEVVTKLLKCDNVDIDHSDVSGCTALYLACLEGNIKIVMELISHSADVNMSPKNLLSPLQIACDKNHIEVVKELLKSDNIDITYSGRTTFLQAGQQGNIEIVKEFISHSVDLNSSGALLVACDNNQIETVRELLKCDNIDINHSNKSGCTAFYLACKEGNIEIVMALISYSVDINKNNNFGYSPLQVVSYNNHIEIVKELLKYETIDIEKTDFSGCTAFYLACMKGNIEIVLNLMNFSVDINKSDLDDMSPLQVASYKNNIEVVEELLKCDNIDMNHCDITGCTAFHLACQKGNVEVVNELILHSVDVIKTDRNGFSPLQIASNNNYVAVVKELLKCDNINIRYNYNIAFAAFFRACWEGDDAIVKRLLLYDMDINKTDQYNWSLLQTACFNNCINTVKNLLTRDNIDIEYSDDSGCTAFYRASQKGNVEIVMDLISYSVDVNKTNELGLTPLQAACNYNQISVVKELLKCDNIDIEHTDNTGSTAFYWTCQKGNVQIVKELISHSVDVNTNDVNGLSPLQAACCHHNMKVVDELLNCDQIDIDHSHYSGCTAFYLACQERKVEIVEKFINHTVDVNICNMDGLTPIQAACYNNHEDVIKKLLINDDIAIDQSDNFGRTALFLAYQRGNVDAVVNLIKHSADVNKSNEIG